MMRELLLKVRRGLVAAFATMAVCAPVAHADGAFPNRPIRIVVPFPPGGTTDVLARIVAVKLQESLGQTVVVDNRPGAGGNIGADNVAKSAADGYSLLLATPGPLSINASLFRSMPFNAERDFTGVGQMIRIQAVLIAQPQSPYRTLGDVLADARRSGKLAYASPGNGTTPHLAAELLASMARVDLQHVPYRGDAPALTDLLGGHVPLMFANIAGVAGQLTDGKVRAIAVTGPTRSPLLPAVPTFAESGVSGYGVTAWAGLVAPAATPPEVVAKLNAALNKALATAEVLDKMRALSAEVAPGTPEALNALMSSERERWAKVIAERQIKLD